MYTEYDEGLGASPPLGSFQRDYPTFVPDEDYSYSDRTKSKTKSFIFPQKLDLSTLKHRGLSTPTKQKKTAHKKKPSPIRTYHESTLKNRENLGSFTNLSELSSKSIDLDTLRRNFNGQVADFLNNSLNGTASHRGSSVTSDRAPSVSSSSTGSIRQRSISIQLNRAKRLVGGWEQQKEEKVDVAWNYDDVFANSDFHLTSSDDDTRPPSSQASLAYEVEHPRRGTSDVISRVTSDGIRRGAASQLPVAARQQSADVRNAATSTSGFLSDSFLADFYKKRGNTDNDCTLVQSDNEKTIVDEVFEDFGRLCHSNSDGVVARETPILRSGRETSGFSNGSARIEAARDIPSMHNLQVGEKTKENCSRAPTNLQHSLSVLTVNQQKIQELQEHAHLNRSLPNLERFVIRPSTRDIFNNPLDIDAICGKGLRKNQKSFSAEKIFGGSQVAKSVHGDKKPTPSSSTSSSAPPRRTSVRQTTSSSAKIREASKSRATSNRQPYCSAAPTDATSYSIGAVSQNLLGAVKSLHPDWLPMIRRLLDTATSSQDVALLFGDELRKQQLALELKFTRNQRSGHVTPEEYDDDRTKLAVLFRVLEKLDELRSRGGQYSRVQQVKLIHQALLNA
uniref:Uncharacterized protein n=2 Tax=Caenorhabditis japonica TaxID=281687 RepID=A0A8R1DQ77_CAEJA